MKNSIKDIINVYNKQLEEVKFILYLLNWINHCPNVLKHFVSDKIKNNAKRIGEMYYDKNNKEEFHNICLIIESGVFNTKNITIKSNGIHNYIDYKEKGDKIATKKDIIKFIKTYKDIKKI